MDSRIGMQENIKNGSEIVIGIPKSEKIEKLVNESMSSKVVQTPIGLVDGNESTEIKKKSLKAVNVTNHLRFANNINNNSHGAESNCEQDIQTKETKPGVEVIGSQVECPDGGWGWICVIGCCIIHILIGGYGRSYGMIYTQLIHRYHSSAALTAWVNGSCSAVRMGFSPVSNALSRRYGARIVVTIGGVILCTGSILTAFSNSTEYFFFSYSTIAGIGGALVYSPSLVVIGEYFSKRRGIAMSLATSGSGLGAFVFPQIMIFLFKRYGFNGGLLLLGALQANACISGLLYRPLRRRHIQPMISIIVVPEDGIQVKAVSAIVDGCTDVNNAKIKPNYITNTDLSEITKVDVRDIEFNDNKKRETSEEKSLEVTAKSSGNNNNKVYRALQWVGSFLDISVWMDNRFSLFALSQGLSVMSYLPVSTFIPAAAYEKHIDETGAAMILSALALGDTVGRLGSGFFFDIPAVRKYRYIPFTSCLFICSVLLLIWPHLYNIRLMMANACFFGVIIGITIAQRTNILCDLVGTSRLSGSHGMLVFAQGIAVFFGPLIGGKLRDVTGNYTLSFVFMAILMIGSGVLSLAAALVAKRRNK